MLKLRYALVSFCSLLAFTVESAGAQSNPEPLRHHTGEAQRAPARGQTFNPSKQVRRAPQGSATLSAPDPRFIVRATTLYANDETGPDWPGSDEIYAVFTLRPPDSKVDPVDFRARTSLFQDFDTGESKPFQASQNCLAPAVQMQPGSARAVAWDCHSSGDSGPLQFSVKLYE